MQQGMPYRSMPTEKEINMEILHVCPANLATGGTEGIHNLVNMLNKVGAKAKILYVGRDLSNPQPEQYKKYECEYITEFPENFEGCIIFPEVMANEVIEDKYKKCVTAVNWQGVDVYKWNNPISKQGLFLQNTKTIHIANSEYAVDYLRGLGLNPVKISDCLNDDYFQEFKEEYERENTVLYNPTHVKLTKFQQIVMSKCRVEYGIKFMPLEGYTRKELIDLFRHTKLYIDFGVFSGRERLPREAVMCGCCILTSDKGTAHYYKDNSIPDKYKIEDIDEAITTIRHILTHYEQCRPEFDAYRGLLYLDKQNYFEEVKELYNEILNHNPSI